MSEKEIILPFSGIFKKLVYEHSALYLRGFPLGDVKKFTVFLHNLKGVSSFNYEQGTGYRHALNNKASHTVIRNLNDPVEFFEMSVNSAFQNTIEDLLT